MADAAWAVIEPELIDQLNKRGQVISLLAEAEATIGRVRAALDDADWGGPERGEVIAEIRATLDQPGEPK